MKHYDVLIATPGAMMEAQYVKSLALTIEECNKRGITYKWLNNYSSLVHHAFLNSLRISVQTAILGSILGGLYAWVLVTGKSGSLFYRISAWV